MSRIGFVLLTHSKPHQIQRLVSRLNTMFDAPPIVIHHDFGKCPLAEEAFPANVGFVKPHVETGWGRFSIVEATVRGFAQMYARSDSPDWCVLLSGACYPTKTAAQIWQDLTTGGFDAHINGRKVDLDAPDTDWHRERYRRYCVKRLDLPVPSLDKRGRAKIRVPRLPGVLGQRLLPFSSSFHCYAGAHWFTANRRAAEQVVSFPETSQGIALTRHYQEMKHYKEERFPEESYFQTILYNAPGLNLNFNNWLYLDWSERKVHPKLLTREDLPAIESSPTHFARKIDIDTDSDLLDALDKLIDAKDADREEAATL